jgi:hypothetical protein
MSSMATANAIPGMTPLALLLLPLTKAANRMGDG